MNDFQPTVRLFNASAWHPDSALKLVEEQVQAAIERGEIGYVQNASGQRYMNATTTLVYVNHDYVAIATVTDLVRQASPHPPVGKK